MVEEKELQQVNEVECVEENQVLDSTQLLNKLSDVKTNQDIKDLTTLFNVSIAKNEMIRALKQDALLDIILKQAAERLEKRPDELSTKDLIDYMNVFQNNLDRASGVVERVNTQPTIQINQHKDVVINVGDLNKNSREEVLEAIKELLKDDGNINNLDEMVNSINTIDKENDEND